MKAKTETRECTPVLLLRELFLLFGDHSRHASVRGRKTAARRSVRSAWKAGPHSPNKSGALKPLAPRAEAS